MGEQRLRELIQGGGSITVTERTAHKLKLRTGPDGVLLFNRYTGVNILVEEIQMPPELWDMAPRHFSIALTNACDLDCYHCFAPKHPARLNVSQIIAWLEELDAHGCLGVGFGGGEPMLYRELPEVSRYVAKETKMAVSLTTHGHRIDDRLAADLKGNVHFIRVSMDGVGATYEKIRKRPFSLLLRQLELIREIAPFGINYLVNQMTFPEIDEAVALAAEIGATEFLLLPEQPTKRSSGIDSYTKQALSRWVESYDGPVPLTVSEAGSEGLPTVNPLPKETGLRAYAHIDASGILKRSSYDTYGVPIGAGGVMEALELLQSLTEDAK